MTAGQLLSCFEDSKGVVVLKAARELKKIAERSPEELFPFRRELLNAAPTECGPLTDLRTRWQLTIVLGALQLHGAQRLAAVDWLFERLQDSSGLQRTFAMQALFDLSVDDAGLRERVMSVVRDFAESGTAAMQARARKLMKG